MKLSGKELSGSVVKNSPAIQEGDTSSISWTRKWNPLQYSCLGNSIERGACWAAVHGVAKVKHNLSIKQQQQQQTEFQRG